jgi:hypothetical protein
LWTFRQASIEKELRNLHLNYASFRNERGFALAAVMILVAIAFVLALSLGVMLVSEITSAKRSTSVTQSFFAAEGGQEYGRRLLDDAMQTFNVPTAITKTTLNSYAASALAGNRSGDSDIGILRDFVPTFDQFLPRGEAAVSANIGSGVDAANYEISYDFTPTAVDLPQSADPSGAFIFYYDYTITSTGTKAAATMSGEQKTKLTGSFEVTIFHPSFAFYNFFTVSMTTAGGSQIYFANSEVLRGPVYVGSKPGFAGNNAGGGPRFTDQFQTTWASYSTSDRIYSPVVQWNSEYPPLWGVPAIPTPSNAFSQARISMGDYAHATDTSTPTNAERRTSLGLLPNTTAPPTGVYYAQGDGSTNNGNNTTNLLGGIYIYGNVDRMRLGADGNVQRITILQGTSTTTIEINQSAGTTVVTPPTGGAKSFNGVPNGLVYVDGSVNKLGGDSSYGASVQSDTQMTVAADQNIYIDNHLTYATDPATNPDAANVLGIYSGRGNVLVSNNAPSNLNLHAIIMATASGKGFGVQDYASKPASGNMNLVGGIIMNSYQAIGTFNSGGLVSGYNKNFTYDQRLLDRSFAPPYFPVVQPYAGRLRSILRTDWTQVVPQLVEQ